MYKISQRQLRRTFHRFFCRDSKLLLLSSLHSIIRHTRIHLLIQLTCIMFFNIFPKHLSLSLSPLNTQFFSVRRCQEDETFDSSIVYCRSRFPFLCVEKQTTRFLFYSTSKEKEKQLVFLVLFNI